MTGNGWWSLFRNPSALTALRADHGLLETAVEELMRYDTPLQMFERWVLEDIEVGGVAIPRGTEVALLFGSANRDPSVFADPDTPRRRPRPQPAHLVRRRHPLLPGRAAGADRAGLLVRRAAAQGAGLRLDAEPEWKPGYIIRGLRELSVSL